MLQAALQRKAAAGPASPETQAAVVPVAPSARSERAPVSTEQVLVAAALTEAASIALALLPAVPPTHAARTFA
jgi:hypothetical protein